MYLTRNITIDKDDGSPGPSFKAGAKVTKAQLKSAGFSNKAVTNWLKTGTLTEDKPDDGRQK